MLGGVAIAGRALSWTLLEGLGFWDLVLRFEVRD
jgi:hypothetical protein